MDMANSCIRMCIHSYLWNTWSHHWRFSLLGGGALSELVASDMQDIMDCSTPDVFGNRMDIKESHGSMTTFFYIGRVSEFLFLVMHMVFFMGCVGRSSPTNESLGLTTTFFSYICRVIDIFLFSCPWYSSWEVEEGKSPNPWIES